MEDTTVQTPWTEWTNGWSTDCR